MRGADREVSTGDRLYKHKELFCPRHDETDDCY